MKTKPGRTWSPVWISGARRHRTRSITRHGYGRLSSSFPNLCFFMHTPTNPFSPLHLGRVSLLSFSGTTFTSPLYLLFYLFSFFSWSVTSLFNTSISSICTGLSWFICPLLLCTMKRKYHMFILVLISFCFFCFTSVFLHLVGSYNACFYFLVLFRFGMVTAICQNPGSVCLDDVDM